MEIEDLDLKLLPLLGALIIIQVLGFFVGLVVKKFTDNIRPKDAWKDDILATGNIIGFLERTIYTLAIIVGHPVFIGGWLAFKVAAKWENWAHIVRLPELKSSDLNSTEFEHRAKFASWLHSRFLIGVLLNIVISIIGAWSYLQFVNMLCMA